MSVFSGKLFFLPIASDSGLMCLQKNHNFWLDFPSCQDCRLRSVLSAAWAWIPKTEKENRAFLHSVIFNPVSWF